MASLERIAVIGDQFHLESPLQQLTDRILQGYPHDGAFRSPLDCQVSAYVPYKENDWRSRNALKQRFEQHGLEVTTSLRQAVKQADAILVARHQWPWSDRLLEETLEQAPKGARCFVYGPLAASSGAADALLQQAARQRITLAAGSWIPTAEWLPSQPMPTGLDLKEALIVVQGDWFTAAWQGLEGLLRVVAARQGGEAGVRRVRFLQGNEVWDAGSDGYWSWPLLASALSRSHTPQGDPVADGRPQDLAGLRRVRGLAPKARGWWMEHRDGMRSTILVLDGVVNDMNFAVKTRDREIHSAQVFHPPAPQEHGYSLLSAVLHPFFENGRRPWPARRERLIAGVLEVMHKLYQIQRDGLETPDVNKETSQ